MSNFLYVTFVVFKVRYGWFNPIFRNTGFSLLSVEQLVYYLDHSEL